MNTVFLGIVVLLMVLAVFDLMVGVSNDAVNFLNSAIGSKVARFRTILLIASLGVIVGAVLSNGMMDIARHGIMMPSMFSFHEVMIIFLAVMVTDVVLLDVFNSLGMPTSTTVSMVFELLGGTFLIAIFKAVSDESLRYGDLLNTDKALEVIIGIFLSVAIAFFVGCVVQWLARIVFTFNYKRHLRWTIALFGGISMTALCYFMFIKGVKNTPLVSDACKEWIDANTPLLVFYTFLVTTILTQLLHLLRVDIFKVVTLVGTFSLAMAFAGNDLVNFIGVPLAGLSSYQDYIANGAGNYDGFMMTSLASSARTPIVFLLGAAAIMIYSMLTSKKAQNVIKTSVDLSRQDESDEMFGSSRVARSLVRFSTLIVEGVSERTPRCLRAWINSRFNHSEVVLADGAAFDMVRASVNLVISGMLIILGTNLKLPLSTTYVTFMVAMGTSLADKAWGRESAVFRITGVLSVIGGWFITAGAAFMTCALVALVMYLFSFPAMLFFVILAAVLLVRSNIRYTRRMRKEKAGDAFTVMLRSHDPEIVWELLRKQMARTQGYVSKFVLDNYQDIINGLNHANLHTLRKVYRNVRKEQDELKKFRRRELLCLRRTPDKVALERNTWFHLASNADQQFMYCLRRMLEPIKEHVDNSFTPIPESYKEEYQKVMHKIVEQLKACNGMISTGRYDQYECVFSDAESTKEELSGMRKMLLDRIQKADATTNLQVDLVYLNTLQESQELLSVMCNQLRSTNKLTDEDSTDTTDDYE